jgi:hypothetical protein
MMHVNKVRGFVWLVVMSFLCLNCRLKSLIWKEVTLALERCWLRIFVSDSVVIKL